jgi:hypothetical protein
MMRNGHAAKPGEGAMKTCIMSMAALFLFIGPVFHAACDAPSAHGRKEVKMEFSEFTERVKGLDCFVISMEGRDAVSPFTGKRYVHYETVAYFGGEDIRSAHRILYHTENGFSLRYAGSLVDVRYGQIRTCIGPAFENSFTAAELTTPRTEAEKAARAVLDEEKAPALLLCEYGLEPGKKYYCRIKTEGYHLPPAGPEGKPRRKENRVLVIADRPFPNDCELTPLYRGWRY